MNTENNLIDCDVSPFVPEGWKVLKHVPGGKITWDTENGLILLFYTDEQRKGYPIPELASDMEKELADKPTLNANALDHILEHQHLIPDEIRGWMRDECAFIPFWGTVYEDQEGKRRVRCLALEDEEWCWSDFDVDNVGLMSCNPAAIRGPLESASAAA